MKTGAAFIAMLALAATGAFAVLRVTTLRRPADARPEGPSVVTAAVIWAGHPATFSLAHALAAGTSLDVAGAWPARTPWAEQAEFAKQAPGEWREAARNVTAVVTLRKHARGDALFAAVRAANPRVVEIDASVLDDRETPSVRLRSGHERGPAFALSPTNAIRIAERIAADFGALRPRDAAVVAENLRVTKERLLRLKAKFEKEFALVAAPEVVGFSEDFDYLCEDFGLQVVERFDADFGRLPPAEKTAMLERLRRAGVRVSLHSYAPTPELVEVLARAKVAPLVLNPFGSGTARAEDFFLGLEANLTALLTALRP